jgi:hypothetical protein
VASEDSKRNWAMGLQRSSLNSKDPDLSEESWNSSVSFG